MKKGSTIILRIAVSIVAMIVLLMCVRLAIEINSETNLNAWEYLVFIILYLSAITFFYAVYQAFKLLNYIDKNIAFTLLSVNALGKIKYCAFIISALYTLILPYFYFVADVEDAPGVMLIGLFMSIAPFVIAVFISVLQRLLNEAIIVKTENDLTV